MESNPTAPADLAAQEALALAQREHGRIVFIRTLSIEKAIQRPRSVRRWLLHTTPLGAGLPTRFTLGVIGRLRYAEVRERARATGELPYHQVQELQALQGPAFTCAPHRGAHVAAGGYKDSPPPPGNAPLPVSGARQPAETAPEAR